MLVRIAVHVLLDRGLIAGHAGDRHHILEELDGDLDASTLSRIFFVRDQPAFAVLRRSPDR